jgi:hypothetical protein
VRVPGSEFRVQGSGFRVQALACPCLKTDIAV